MEEDKALAKAVSKIYEQLSETGEITKEQFMIIQMYEKKRQKTLLQILVDYGNEIKKIVDEIFPVDGGSK